MATKFIMSRAISSLRREPAVMLGNSSIELSVVVRLNFDHSKGVERRAAYVESNKKCAVSGAPTQRLKSLRQHLHDRRVALFSGNVRRRFAVIVSRLNVSPVLYQVAHHLNVAILSGSMKRGPSSLLTSIGGRSFLQQQAHDLAAVSSGRAMQGCYLHRVMRGCIYLGCATNQITRNLSAIEEGREMQRSESVCRPALRRPGIAV